MKKIFLVLFNAALFLPVAVLAQGLKDAAGKLTQTDVGLTASLPGAVNRVVDMVFYITGTVFLLLLIYGAIVYLKSAGRENEIARAKRIIFTSVVGTVVVVAAYAITIFVFSRI